MIFGKRTILLLAAVWPLAAGADTPLAEARSTLEKWVETRQVISKTRSDWQSDKEMLEQTCQLLERELTALDEQFSKLTTNNTLVEKERLQAEATLKSADDAVEQARVFAAGFEPRVETLVPQLPAPLQELVKPFVNRIPKDPGNTKLGTTERLQALVGILNEVDKFNSSVSLFSEKRKDSKGDELAVETIYVGLGAAYFASDSGTFAGTGLPSLRGWEWTPVDGIGSAVKEVARIYRNERPARFIPLPAVIR